MLKIQKKSHSRPKYSILCKQKVNIFGLPTYLPLLVGSIGRYVNMPKKIEKKFERNIPSLARVVVRISIPDYDKRFLLFNVNFQLTEWIPKVMMQRQQTRKIQAWLNSLTIQYWRYKKKSHPRPKYSILCKQKVNIFGLPTTYLFL